MSQNFRSFFGLFLPAFAIFIFRLVVIEKLEEKSCVSVIFKAFQQAYTV
jgi:hypothetical protein